MANKELQGNNFDIPIELMDNLKSILDSFKGNESARGYSRLKNLIDKGRVSYEQAKRIKNYFDINSPDENITEYRLNGGERMKNWIEDVLSGEREKVDHHKRIKKDTGVKNSFRKEYTNSKPLDRDYLMDKMHIDENFIKSVNRINENLE